MADQFASNVTPTQTTETDPKLDSEPSDVAPTSRSTEEVGLSKGPVADEGEWVDLTETFRTMSLALGPGELLHDARFTLLDSMTAVEFMDPRMDLYVRSKWTRHGPVTVKESLDNLVELDNFSDEEVLGVVDELLALTSTWLEGHTLAQTVFTCVYLHQPDRVGHPLLRSLLLALCASVEHLRRALDRAEVCVEDDHQTITLGLSTEVPAPQLAAGLTELKEAEDALQLCLKKAARTIRAGTQEPAPSEQQQLPLQQAVLARVRMVRHLWLFLQSMVGDKPRASGAIHKDLITQCISACQEVRETLQLGCVFDDLEKRVRLGFDDAINNAILPPSPRQVSVMSRGEGVDYLLTTLQGLQEVTRICELTSLRDIQAAVIQLCSSPDCANVTVRSFLSNSLCNLFAYRRSQEEESLLEGLIRQDMRSLSHPPVLNPRDPLSSHARARELVGELLVQLVAPMRDGVLLHCCHRSLHQERITFCLSQLGDLQLEVEATDHFLQELARNSAPPHGVAGGDHNRVFSAWLLRCVLLLMIDYVNAGLELRLYTAAETHSAMWYLDYLYSCLGRILTGAKVTTEREWSHASKSGKQKAKLKKTSHYKDLERDLQLTSLKKVMCSALMRAVEAAAADQKLSALASSSPHDELRYRHRFSSFSFIATPRVRIHSEYLQDLSVSAYSCRHTNLFVLASKGLQTAKTALESLPPSETTRSLLRIVKTNIIVCNLAAAGRHKEDSSLLSLDYSVHKHFPILRLL